MGEGWKFSLLIALMFAESCPPLLHILLFVDDQDINFQQQFISLVTMCAYQWSCVIMVVHGWLCLLCTLSTRVEHNSLTHYMVSVGPGRCHFCHWCSWIFVVLWSPMNTHTHEHQYNWCPWSLMITHRHWQSLIKYIFDPPPICILPPLPLWAPAHILLTFHFFVESEFWSTRSSGTQEGTQNVLVFLLMWGWRENLGMKIFPFLLQFFNSSPSLVIACTSHDLSWWLIVVNDALYHHGGGLTMLAHQARKISARLGAPTDNLKETCHAIGTWSMPWY
jgi:hypothetical protein